jgi:GAF domain-containing protein
MREQPESDQQALLNRITNQIRQSLEFQDILEATVNEVRTFLGTDRVKIYQFQPEGHGLVIAESLEPDRLPSLLELNFPADDIPPYARELYLQTRQRTIVDLATEEIGISPLNSFGDSHSEASANIQYRPVDPCHMEYLRSMGVMSSVVVPIVVEAEQKKSSVVPAAKTDSYLWGLLVSHHSEKKTVLEQDLSLLQAVVNQAEIAISHSILLRNFREQSQQKANINRILGLLHGTTPMNLQAALEETVKLFNGSGGRISLPPNTLAKPKSALNLAVSESLLQESLSGEIYVYGDQPDYLDLEKTRSIEDNLIWQEFLKSVLPSQGKNQWVVENRPSFSPAHTTESQSPLDSSENGTETAAVPDDVNRFPESFVNKGSVQWMRAVYALENPEKIQDNSGPIWAVSDIYQEPLFRSLTPAFQATDIHGLLIIPLHLGQEVVGCLTIFRETRDQELVWAGVCNPDRRQMAPRQSWLYRSHYANVCGEHLGRAKMPETLDFSII